MMYVSTCCQTQIWLTGKAQMRREHKAASEPSQQAFTVAGSERIKMMELIEAQIYYQAVHAYVTIMVAQSFQYKSRK